jgi:hypothetical protein
MEAFAGLRNDTTPERFTRADLSVANNVDIDNTGQISLRSGYTLVSAGAFHSLYGDPTRRVAVVNGVFSSIDAANAITPLKSLTDAVSKIGYSVSDNRLFFSNGTDSGVLQNGSVRTWGLTPPTALGAIATIGNLPAGSYQFTMTYVRNDGQESGAGLGGILTLPLGSGLTFALPVSSDPSVTSKNIYLTTPNGGVLYLAMSVPNAQTTASYVGDTKELNLELITQFMENAPSGQLSVVYKGRMYVASGSMLYPSQPFNYELFNLREAIALDGRITMLAAIEEDNNLFIGTDKSVGIVVGDTLEEFKYIPKLNYGAIEGALTFVDGSLWGDNSTNARMLPVFLTTRGICVAIPQGEIKNTHRTRYSFTTSGQGAALFNPVSNRLILSAYH